MTTAPPDRSGADPASLRSYVAAWVVAGVAAAALAAWWHGPFATAELVPFLVLLGLTAASEAANVKVRSGASGLTLSLVETMIVVDLLLLGPTAAFLVIVGGLAIQNAIRHIALLKWLFNLGQHAVSATVAVGLVSLAPSAPVLNVPRVLVVAITILAMRTISTLALMGIFRRIGAEDLRQELTDQPMEVATTTFGNTSLGVIAVGLWTAYPSVVWIVVGPALALYLAYGARHRIEDLLGDVRIERDRLDRVVGGVREGIVLLDAEGGIRLWNSAMTTMLGHEEGAVLGRPAREVLHGIDDHGAPMDPEGPVRQRATDITTVARVTDIHGDEVPVRLVHTLLRDEHDEVVGDVVVVHDLTRERETAAMKEDFVARVSHELRTPLSPLRGYAQGLLRAGDRVTPEKRNEVLETMVERVGHLERLIDDLLLVSQIGTGRVDPARTVDLVPVDPRTLLPRLVSWLDQGHTRAHEVEVVETAEQHVALGDPLRVGQIVTNLLTNACKYGTPGTPVVVRTAGDATTVSISVEDRGPGIPSDKLESIFERFERLDDPQRMQVGGIGLGLYISRQLAEAMGGTLTVTSTRHVGSTFTLTLPRDTTSDPGATADTGTRETAPVPARERRLVPHRPGATGER